VNAAIAELSGNADNPIVQRTIVTGVRRADDAPSSSPRRRGNGLGHGQERAHAELPNEINE
jgi:hypothetical protein